MHARGEAGVQSHGLNTPGCSSSQINAHTRIPQHVRLPGRGGQAAQPREKSQESRRCKTERAGFECNNRRHRPGDDLKKSWGCAANLVFVLLEFRIFISLSYAWTWCMPCETCPHSASMNNDTISWKPATHQTQRKMRKEQTLAPGFWIRNYNSILSSLNENSYFGNIYSISYMYL